jgi:hypothetical protein
MPEWVPWVFSGVGVFVIGLVIAALRYIRRPQTPIQTAEKLPPVTLSVVLAAPTPPSPAQVPADIEFMDLDRVVEAISDAPLLQQAGMLEHYVGLRTRFTGTLISASKTPEERISVALGAVGQRKVDGVVFEINPAGYPGLGLLRSGHEVTVVGRLKNVSSRVVWLEDAEVSFKLPA